MKPERHLSECVSYKSGDRPTCVWLKDGTKVVLRCEHNAVWLEVEKQTVIRPMDDISLRPTVDAPHGYCDQCRQPLETHCEECQGLPYKPSLITASRSTEAEAKARALKAEEQRNTVTEQLADLRREVAEALGHLELCGSCSEDSWNCCEGGRRAKALAEKCGDGK